MKALKFVEKLLDHSDKVINLKLLQSFLIKMIPFNRPHGFKYVKVDKSEVLVSIPFKRLNKNHLGTIHACCHATGGELAAGTVLLKNFAVTDYRLVMNELKVTYHTHGNSKLLAVAKISQEQVALVKKELAEKETAFIQIESNLYREDDKLSSTVYSNWQLKPWAMVKR